MLLIVAVIGVFLNLLDFGSCSIMPFQVIEKIEREFFPRINHPCHLVISSSALAHVDAAVVESRPTFVMNLERDAGIEAIMAESIRDQSFCIILLALEARRKEERTAYENVVSMKSPSFIVLLSTAPTIQPDHHHHQCSSSRWFKARRSFHLDLRTDNIKITACCSLWTSPGSKFLEMVPFDFLRNPKWMLGTKFGDKCSPPVYGKEVNVAFGFVPPFVTYDGDFSNPGGIEPEMAKIIFAKFRAVPKMNFTSFQTGADPKTGKFTSGGIFMVANEYHELSIGSKFLTYVNIVQQDLDHLGHILTDESKLVSRPPQIINRLDKLLSPFPALLWSVIYMSLMFLSAVMALAFLVYKRLPNSEELLQSPNLPVADFILLPLTKFVEPDPLPWFSTFSTGRMLTLLWSLFTMILIFSYQSNLRMHLVTPLYEKPVETFEDALNRGQNIYVAYQIYVTILANTLKNTTTGRVTDRIVKSNGFYDATAQLLLPEKVVKDIKENGALYWYGPDLVIYQYLLDKSLARKNLQMTKESSEPMHCTFAVKRYNQFSEDLMQTAQQIKDMGFKEKIFSDMLPMEAQDVWRPQLANPETPIQMDQVLLILLGQILGLLAAVISFCIERRVKKYDEEKVDNLRI